MACRTCHHCLLNSVAQNANFALHIHVAISSRFSLLQQIRIRYCSPSALAPIAFQAHPVAMKLNLDTINAHISEHRVAQLADAVHRLETAVAAGRVQNPVFVKSKGTINLAVSDAVHRFNETHRQFMRFNVLVLSAYNVPAAHKEAVREGADGRAAFLADLLPLHDLLQSAKPLIVKRVAGATTTTVSVPKSGAMTCQICDRSIFAASGVIALHGYRRPWGGGQTASCAGALCAPFEVSRERLGRLIAELRDEEASRVRILEDVDAERSPVLVPVTDRAAPLGRDGRRPSRDVPVTRENFEGAVRSGAVSFLVPDFDHLKAGHVAGLRHAIETLRAEIDAQTRRFDGWMRTHAWEAAGKKWIPLADAARLFSKRLPATSGRPAMRA